MLLGQVLSSHSRPTQRQHHRNQLKTVRIRTPETKKTLISRYTAGRLIWPVQNNQNNQFLKVIWLLLSIKWIVIVVFVYLPCLLLCELYSMRQSHLPLLSHPRRLLLDRMNNVRTHLQIHQKIYQTMHNL